MELTNSYQVLLSHTIVSKVIFYLEGKVDSQDQDANASTVTYRTKIVVSGSGNYYESYGISSYINGDQKSIGHETYSTGTTVLQTKTVTYTHNNDGSYSGTVTTRYACNYGSSLSTTSVAFDLPTIERGATISSIDKQIIGEAFTITINNPLSMTYDISWADSTGNVTGTMSGLTDTIPYTVLNYLPYNKSASITFTIISTDGTNTITSQQTFEFTADSDDANVQPSVITINSYAPTTGLSRYASGYSACAVDYDITGLTGAYNSYIVVVQVVLDGYVVSADMAPTVGNYTYTSPVLSEGSHTIVIRAMDSRGIYETETISITVEAYSPPTFAGSIERDTTTTTDINVDGVITYSSLSGYNSVTWSVTNGSTTATGSGGTVNTALSNSLNNQSYTVELTMTDGITSTTYTVEVPTAEYIMVLERYTFGTGGYPTHKGTSSQFVNDLQGMTYLEDLEVNVTTGSGVISRTSGGTVTDTYHKVGQIVHMGIHATNSSSVSSGSNFFVGTLDSSMLPSEYVTSVAYTSALTAVLTIDTSGNVIIRNASASSMASGRNLYFGFTYIVA